MNSLPGYDRWLEAPFQRACDREDEYQKWLAEWESEMKDEFMANLLANEEFSLESFDNYCRDQYERAMA